jgi:LPS O-antigen subunit length determinant protein (WzzB/FepE family)
MQQSEQEVQIYQEDEINLRALFNSLVVRRFLIAGLTGFITILAIIYSLTLPANYQATSSFTSAPSSSIANINRLIYLNETKNSIFTSFLTSVSSQKLQKNVFLENDFITVFNKNNDPIEDIDEFISNILRSIKINPPKLKASDMAIYLDEKPYSISFTGSDKKAISRYLEKLIEHADKENIMELSKLNKVKTGIRLDEISIESALLLEKEKVIRLNQIETLTAAAKLAKSLGVIENNLNIFRDINAVTIAIGESNSLPDWYLYGEKALLQRIDVLVNRHSDAPYIPELVALNTEKDRLKSEHNLSGASSINLISSSNIENISSSKRQIVLIAFIVGLMMSIFLVLIMSAFKPNEKKLLPK